MQKMTCTLQLEITLMPRHIGMLIDIIRRLVNTFPTDGIHARGGGGLGLNHASMCVSKSEGNGFFFGASSE